MATAVVASEEVPDALALVATEDRGQHASALPEAAQIDATGKAGIDVGNGAGSGVEGGKVDGAVAVTIATDRGGVTGWGAEGTDIGDFVVSPEDLGKRPDGCVGDGGGEGGAVDENTERARIGDGNRRLRNEEVGIDLFDVAEDGRARGCGTGKAGGGCGRDPSGEDAIRGASDPVVVAVDGSAFAGI